VSRSSRPWKVYASTIGLSFSITWIAASDSEIKKWQVFFQLTGDRLVNLMNDQMLGN
jgi:hypothetical protein